MLRISRIDKETFEHLCFKHAVLRAQNGRTIIEEITGDDGIHIITTLCADCAKNDTKDDNKHG